MLSLFSCLFVLLAAGIPGSLGLPQARGEIKPSLSILARISTTGFANLVEVDRARAEYLRSGKFAPTSEARNFRRTSSFSVQNTAVTYTANVGVGSPPTDYTLLIDTGSSITWVGAGKNYVKTKTSKPTGQPISVTYGGGSFSGEVVIDTVQLSPALIIPGQSIGVANQSQNFEGLDGVLGIGPVGLTEGTTPAPTVPTVADNLMSKGKIVTESIGVFFAPVTAIPSTGELTFGDVDTSKTLSDVHFVPLTHTPPASLFWGIDQSVSYGTTTVLKSNAGIVDTGTTMILFATDAFSIYQKATGAVFDPVTGLFKLTASQFDALKPLDFHIGGRTFSLSPNAQIWPRTLNAGIGGDPDGIYLVVADLGRPSGQGFDFVNGFVYHERFYTVYDTTNNQVGFASTAFTDANIN